MNHSASAQMNAAKDCLERAAKAHPTDQGKYIEVAKVHAALALIHILDGLDIVVTIRSEDPLRVEVVS